MDGILNILKPPDMTSFDVVAFLRGVLRIKKIGHAGTLDPGAVGVLPVCIGKATKAIEYMMEKDKVYRTELTLGADTDTQDSTGTVLNTWDADLTEESVREAFKSFVGTYGQVPPMYSAVKVNGKKLYELARSGITVEREAREVEIHSLDILSIERDRDTVGERRMRVLFDVHCSKGTYIRTLCADIGKALNCGGHMSFLLRSRSGVFEISGALTLEEVKQLEETGALGDRLIKVEKVFGDFEAIVLEGQEEKRFLNGQRFKYDKGPAKCGLVRVYGPGQVFLALGKLVPSQDGMLLKSEKLFI